MWKAQLCPHGISGKTKCPECRREYFRAWSKKNQRDQSSDEGSNLMPLPEIAEKLGLSLNQVRWSLETGMKKLRANPKCNDLRDLMIAREKEQPLAEYPDWT